MNSESISEETSSLGMEQNLSNLNNDFQPIERKNALRKSLGYRKFHLLERLGT